MRAWEGFTAFFRCPFSWKNTFWWAGEVVHYHLTWVQGSIIISCVLGVLERIETQSLKRIIWGLNWTSSQLIILRIASYSLQSRSVGSSHGYEKLTVQQLMSNRKKWELCHCFRLLSQTNVGLSLLKFKKKILPYLSSLQPSSCNEFYSWLNGLSLRWVSCIFKCR